MKNKWIIIVIVVIALCCLCSTVLGGAYYFLGYRPARAQAAIQPLLINASDIPADWPDDHYGSATLEDGASGAINIVYDYYYPGEGRAYNWLSHEVILYPTEQAASKGFNAFKEKWLTYSGDVVVEFNFAPHNPQDPYEYKCTDAAEPGHQVTICYFIQQHGRYLSFFFPKFDGKTLTSTQVDAILTRLDARLP
jgi:hypothetical protein